jgi:hypothetical protein
MNESDAALTTVVSFSTENPHLDSNCLFFEHLEALELYFS